MSDDTTTPEAATAAPVDTTPAPAQDAPAAEAAEASAPAVDTPSDWSKHLESVSTDDLRRHPKVAGLVGNMVDQAMRRWRADQDQQVSQRAAQEAEEQLLKLAKDDPEAFSERFLSDKQRERALQNFSRLREDTRAEFAKSVGRAYQDAPGWDEIDHTALAKAIQGLPDDEIIPAFHKAAMGQLLEINAQKKAKAEFDGWKTKELAKEREALRKEVAAELLKKDAKPDLTRARTAGAGRPAWLDLSPGPEFDAAYEREILGRR